MKIRSEISVMKCPNCGANMVQYKNQYKCQYCDAIVSIKLPSRKKKKKLSLSQIWDKFIDIIIFVLGIAFALAFLYFLILVLTHLS